GGGGDGREGGLGVGGLGQEEGPVLPADQRNQLVHDQVGDDGEVAVPLHLAGDPGQVGLQPVLFLVGLGRLPQRVDHGVDVVLEVGDLALRPARDGAGQVTGG